MALCKKKKQEASLTSIRALLKVTTSTPISSLKDSLLWDASCGSQALLIYFPQDHSHQLHKMKG